MITMTLNDIAWVYSPEDLLENELLIEGLPTFYIFCGS